MEQLYRLDKIADVSAGLVIKRKEASQFDRNTAGCFMLTLRGFDTSGFIDKNLLDRFESKHKLESKYLTHENDIVIRLSKPYTAIVIDDNTKGYLIPSNFAVIRIRNLERFHPGYIAFILNKQTTKHDYFKNSFGITIPMLKVETIRNTMIFAISHRKQELVAKINHALMREKMLIDALGVQRREIIKVLENQIAGLPRKK